MAMARFGIGLPREYRRGRALRRCGPCSQPNRGFPPIDPCTADTARCAIQVFGAELPRGREAKSRRIVAAQQIGDFAHVQQTCRLQRAGARQAEGSAGLEASAKAMAHGRRRRSGHSDDAENAVHNADHAALEICARPIVSLAFRRQGSLLGYRPLSRDARRGRPRDF